MRAALLGAVALLACNDGEALDLSRVAAARSLAADVEPARLLADVSAVVAAHRGEAPVDCSTLEAPTEVMCHDTHLGARAWLAGAFESLGYEVTLERADDGSLDAVNVIASLPGRTPELVLVGAHYDAAYAAADDDSTGVAVVVELARVLRGRRFERTVRFIGFDLEELGMVGSASHARSAAGRETIAAVFNVDSVGVTAPSQPYLPGIAFPSTGDFLAVIGSEGSVQLAADTRALSRVLDLGKVEAVIAAGDGTAPLLGFYGVGSGDHAPFWTRNIPAVILTDTGPVRDPSYHSSADDVAHLDLQFFASSARVVAAAVAYAAGAR